MSCYWRINFTFAPSKDDPASSLPLLVRPVLPAPSSTIMQALRDKLRHIEELFLVLPDSLPLNSTGNAVFGLDSDDFEDLGYAGALNRCFEINWGMRINKIHITERGDKLKTTVAIFREALTLMTAADDIGLVEIWLDILINSAEAAAMRSKPDPPLVSSTSANPQLPAGGPGADGAPSTIALHRVSVQHKPRNSLTMRQTKLLFKKIPREEWDEQETAATHRLRARIAHDRAKELLLQEKKENLRRAHERNRKQKQRLRRKGLSSSKIIELEDSRG
ncbi:hypothetical protein NUW54_g4423 [Trametes sanguinea]|uniref:Uncharacterized protein n=1 Tax=Trametes sanguinea TaxID=158606 RepID=A0ACC1PZV1_9APHY|nr:hypothetical protein NUW54_g4423 [Trametes sanguinea]